MEGVFLILLVFLTNFISNFLSSSGCSYVFSIFLIWIFSSNRSLIWWYNFSLHIEGLDRSLCCWYLGLEFSKMLLLTFSCIEYYFSNQLLWGLIMLVVYSFLFLKMIMMKWRIYITFLFKIREKIIPKMKHSFRTENSIFSHEEDNDHSNSMND